MEITPNTVARQRGNETLLPPRRYTANIDSFPPLSRERLDISGNQCQIVGEEAMGFFTVHFNPSENRQTKYWILIVLYLTNFVPWEKHTLLADTTTVDESQIISLPFPSPNNPIYEEQLQCDPSDCHSLDLNPNNSDKTWDEVYKLMGKQAGKILIEVTEDPAKIDDLDNIELMEYLREISKREGKVVFEPYYINTRGESIPGPPLLKDLFSVGYSLYKRLRSYFVFGRVENYNAKILYHPITHKILIYYFVHKQYGDLCETVYSNCQQVEYLDDETFDLQLANLLKSNSAEKREIVVQFKKTEAKMPISTLSVDNLMSMDRSSRLYKWFVASKKVKSQPVKRDRFLSLQLAIMIIDYTITAYELVQKYRMYSVANHWEATASYEDTAEGKKIKTVTFRPLSQNDTIEN